MRRTPVPVGYENNQMCCRIFPSESHLGFETLQHLESLQVNPHDRITTGSDSNDVPLHIR